MVHHDNDRGSFDAGKMFPALCHSRRLKAELDADLRRLDRLREQLRGTYDPKQRRVIQLSIDSIELTLKQRRDQVDKEADYFDRRFGIAL